MTSPNAVPRRGVLAACGALLLAGCSSGGDDATPTPDPLERGEVTEPEHATMLAFQAVNGAGPWVTEVRSVEPEQLDDGFRLHVRFGLDRREMGSPEDQAADTEDSFLRTAEPVLKELAGTSLENLTEIHIAGYVPTENTDVERTEDGSAVAAELRISLAAARSIEWDSYDRTDLPEDADSYALNEDVFRDG